MDKFDKLKLDNQLCFPLYVISKEVVRNYAPVLKRLGLTYTHYIVLMALWEEKTINVKELGNILYLDSGTLTPVLNKLESKGFIEKIKSNKDKRVVDIHITDNGMKLREEALFIPDTMRNCFELSDEEAKLLYKILRKMMQQL